MGPTGGEDYTSSSGPPRGGAASWGAGRWRRGGDPQLAGRAGAAFCYQEVSATRVARRAASGESLRTHCEPGLRRAPAVETAGSWLGRACPRGSVCPLRGGGRGVHGGVFLLGSALLPSLRVSPGRPRASAHGLAHARGAVRGGCCCRPGCGRGPGEAVRVTGLRSGKLAQLDTSPGRRSQALTAGRPASRRPLAFRPFPGEYAHPTPRRPRPRRAGSQPHAPESRAVGSSLLAASQMRFWGSHVGRGGWQGEGHSGGKCQLGSCGSPWQMLSWLFQRVVGPVARCQVGRRGQWWPESLE